MKMNLLKGKVALITGASRGIVKAIAKRFHAKQAVMPLLSSGNTNDPHDHSEVQRQALQCISKLLVTNWKGALFTTTSSSSSDFNVTTQAN